MNNEDMTRFYEVGTDLGRPGDFVRRDKDGKVPGSGGGTTLNRYEYDVDLSSMSYSIRGRITNIAKKAVKYSMYATLNLVASDNYGGILSGYLLFGEYAYIYSGIVNSGDMIANVIITNNGDSVTKTGYVVRNNTISSISRWNSIRLKIIYYNDTEITA